MNHRNYVAYLNSKNKTLILERLKNHPECVIFKGQNMIKNRKEYKYSLTDNGRIAVFNSKTGEIKEYTFTFDGEYIYLV